MIAILVYFSYAVNINYTGGGIGRGTIYKFLNLGLLRVLADVGIGYLFAIGMSKIPNIKKGHISCAGFTVAELASVIVLGINWFYKPMATQNQIVVILMFMTLFACCCLGNGIISKFFLNNRSLAFMGKYTYSIYVMQQITFWILQRTFWQKTAFVQHHWCATIMISIAICIIVGIIVYYLIEQPAIRFYREKIQNQ